MVALLVIGVVIACAGVVLLLNLAASADFVMRHVTSKDLGTLPPGFANTKRGFRIYAVLVIAIGLLFAGLGLAESSIALGMALFALGLVGFVVTSVLAIRGEVATAKSPRR